MFSNPLVIFLRKVLRGTRFLSILKGFLKSNREYEYKFKNEMTKNLKEGMIVFDIGANIGLYTKLFAEIVKESGHIFAFEPCQGSANKIKEMQSMFPWITINQSVVGEKDGKTIFETNKDNPTFVGNKVLFDKNVVLNDSQLSEIEMLSVDSICQNYLTPNFIKIDVEGYELNVLRGAKKTLLNNQLKHIFIEIHFAELDRRGQPYAPHEIVKILSKSGFKIKFHDSSHLHAFKV